MSCPVKYVLCTCRSCSPCSCECCGAESRMRNESCLPCMCARASVHSPHLLFVGTEASLLLSIRVHFTAGYHCLRNAHSRIQLPEYLWFMQALSAHLLLTHVEVVTIVCARDSYVLPSDFFYKTVVRCLLILKNHTSRHVRCF